MSYGYFLWVGILTTIIRLFVTIVFIVSIIALYEIIRYEYALEKQRKQLQKANKHND